METCYCNYTTTTNTYLYIRATHSVLWSNQHYHSVLSVPSCCLVTANIKLFYCIFAVWVSIPFHKKRSRTNYILQINYYFNAQVTRIKRTCTGIIILTALSDVSCLFNFLLFPLWHAVYFSLIILLNIILLPVELFYNFLWWFRLNLLKKPLFPMWAPITDND